MARIEFRNLGHAYGPNPASLEDYALQPMNMVWEDGGAYALLGPSGCGKSTLLNIISGLLVPSEGQVLFDGKDMTQMPTRERNIAQVFQFPVLYDTMSVFDNLAFPLRNRKVAESEVRARVHEIAEILELTRDLKQRASGLSADARQKISLGRGLVRKDVAAILFDEPLTVIDPHMKWQLRQKLKQIHHQLKLTLIYVTHDQVEALTFADEVVVMTNGKVVQQGKPEALFVRPDHTFVGYFIGSPGMNFYPLQIDGDAVVIGQQRVNVDAAQLQALKHANGELKLGIRPEFVELTTAGAPGAVSANVVQVQHLGTSQLLTAEFGGQIVKARLDASTRLSEGQKWLRLAKAETIFFSNDERIGR
ncbi:MULTISPECIES: ABC transporter ATP-binding protein [unclassified Herbaspirillum]|uniref:ABC transporter ATP-binding protein n=1 Tax=unclassified Herbaspirillum TaxID=2624150 RepID=UPI000E2FB7D4|nr:MULTISPECIES: ABC transporter ATP-binding protein [unclassified Herbaspirillum]RFB65582.1 ABC transporter ATP-binding protein [Herbaspirillum sp. 3R-3a1]TFI08159.1 ABC transporter ATP-binding protein [Herbaspirillum sp. 3R11]TFI14574.1 ABC transporter ATP-binding protein [Herbaspirillum sp. 3R-11]TFI22412.1 ABC transporter ATP-binding protein [Herbaspirillum sp. 3C11]